MLDPLPFGLPDGSPLSRSSTTRDELHPRSADLPAIALSGVATDTLPKPIPVSNNSDAEVNHPVGAANRLSFDSAFRRVMAHEQGLSCVAAPLKQLRVAGNRLIGPDGPYRLGSEGIRRLAEHFRAPADYLGQLSPHLCEQLLNHHLRTTPARGSNHIYHRDGAFVGFSRADLHRMDSAQVLGAVREGFGTDALDFEAERLDIGNESFNLDLVSPRIAIEVRRGDLIQAGVRVEHSYTGDRATTVLGFVVRLVCTNGMVHRECLGSRRTSRTRRLNADREDAGILQYDQIKRLASEVRAQIGPKLEDIKRLAGERADEAQLKQFLAQARMNSQALRQQLREAWEAEENELTKFGLFNALTRLATHGTALSARQRGTLARLAGIYASSSTHLCPHCFSVLGTPAAR